MSDTDNMSGNEPRGRIQSILKSEDSIAFIYTDEEKPQHPKEEIVTSTHILSEILQSKKTVNAITTPKERLVEKLQEEMPDKETYYCLIFFESSLFATILEDTMTELRILTECNDELRIMKTLSDMPLLRALKYKVAQPKVHDELDGIDPRKLNCNEYKLNKLDADRNLIQNLFTNLYTELAIERCFSPLIDFVNVIINRQKYANVLLDDEENNKNLRRELMKHLRQQRTHYRTVKLQAEFVIASLRSQIEDADLMTETKGRYVDNWQAARTEQHELVIFNDESVFTNSMEYYKKRSDIETRVHAEIEHLTGIIINETLQKVEDWMEKYDTDMEQIDLKIQIQRNDYQTALEKRREMERTFQKHARQAREWIEFKENRAAAHKYHDDMMRCATTVQAWWRGLLVRKKLGPYRPKKEKKGRGKK